MVGKTKTPTKDEKRRMNAIVELGCLCCRRTCGQPSPAEVHHVVEGGKRLGHLYTLPLCRWHHRGIPPEGIQEAQAKALYGPSLALNKKEFIHRYGTERDQVRLVDLIMDRRGMA